MLKKFISSSLLVASGSIMAAGLDLSEYSTASSIGSAGVANQTHTRDASAAALNLAAMSFVEGDQIMSGFALMDFHSKFENDGNSVPGGPDVGNAGDMFPVPFFGYVNHLNDDWTFGFTINSHFGLALDYPTYWAGRVMAQDLVMQSVNMSPSFAYKINDKLSLGAGLVIDYAMFEMKFASNNGQIEIEDNNIGFGGIFSVYYRPTETTSMGLTYRTEIKHDYEDNVETRGAVAGILRDFSMDNYTPQQLFFGIRQDINENLAVLGSLNWQEWSRFGESPITADNLNIGVDRKLDDTWGAGLSIEYQLNDDWLLICGYHYDSAMMDTSNRTADLSTANIHRYGVGAECKLNEKMTLGFAFEHVDLGKPNINQSVLGETLSGQYDNYINFYTVNLAYKL